MPFYEAANSFVELGGWQIGNPGIVTLDAENVLTPYGDPTLFDGVLEKIDELHRGASHVAIATNNKDIDFIAALHRQLPPEVPVFSGLTCENKKTSPDMFLKAAAHFDVDPSTGVHVEDQFLSLRGARMAGFAGLVIVKPIGPNGHKGVKFGRLIDTPARIGIGAVQGARRLLTDGIDG